MRTPPAGPASSSQRPAPAWTACPPAKAAPPTAATAASSAGPWANLAPTAKSFRACGIFRRRVFWLPPHDRDSQPDGDYAKGAPSEAFDPRTLEPRVKGYKTERSE